MKTPLRRLVFACLLTAALAGCAGAPPPPGTTIDPVRLQAMAQPGKATRASIAAAFGTTRKIAFDNGNEVWLYLVPADGGTYTEVVLLFDHEGVLRKVRQRPPHAYDRPDKS